jgi:SAM-dependent methyltransferase
MKMDLNETSGIVENRHPWELSRTQCIMKAFRPYLDKLHEKKNKLSYINVGAGDLYFDHELLKLYPQDTVHAVDIAYPELNNEGNINKYHYLKQVNETADYAIMMDSLEYIENDVAFLNEMAGKISDGGWFLFTLPAFPFLFSEYDVLIKNLRRYSRKTFREVIGNVSDLEIVKEHHFYTLLFVVRLFEKLKKQKYDPDKYLTAMWKHEEKGFVTQMLKFTLNLDFAINKFFGKLGIHLPGLSLFVLCRVKKAS